MRPLTVAKYPPTDTSPRVQPGGRRSCQRLLLRKIGCPYHHGAADGLHWKIIQARVCMWAPELTLWSLSIWGNMGIALFQRHQILEFQCIKSWRASFLPQKWTPLHHPRSHSRWLRFFIQQPQHARVIQKDSVCFVWCKFLWLPGNFYRLEHLKGPWRDQGLTESLRSTPVKEQWSQRCKSCKDAASVKRWLKCSKGRRRIFVSNRTCSLPFSSWWHSVSRGGNSTGYFILHLSLRSPPSCAYDTSPYVTQTSLPLHSRNHRPWLILQVEYGLSAFLTCRVRWRLLGGCIDTRSSTTGFFIVVNDTPIVWKSKKQTVTTLSSGEAEYIALSTCAKEVSCIRKQFWELLIKSDTWRGRALLRHSFEWTAQQQFLWLRILRSPVVISTLISRCITFKT